MNFIPNDREPVYIQIVRYMKQQVVNGYLSPGDAIPSRREMAVSIKVNPNTVQKAYKEMEDMGIINTARNYQSTITTDANIINDIKQNLIDESMELFIESMKAINVDKEEIIKINEEDPDEKMFLDFINRIETKNYDSCVSYVGEVIDSHVATFASEFANVSETVVDVESFFNDAVEMTKQIEKMMF